VRKFLATAAMAATSAIPALAQAQTATTLDSADSGDTAWLLAASALVLMMAAPGLTLFYGGLVRAKGFLAVMVQTGAIIAVASLLWIAAGYTLAFGPVGQWLDRRRQRLDAAQSRQCARQLWRAESAFALFQMCFARSPPR
jgi:Amt family ammonium transporter